ncbi:MAG TPA: nucleotide sugar dehydrogenase [Planctomycetaceae bacterium]|nr:nucleotide sugar dehydrogenase [Planctomycetaceae bacterium]
MKRVAVFGMGYVGCVTAACLSRDGHRVTGVDIDEDKLAAVAGGRSPVSEPGLDELIGEQVAAGRLTTTLNTDAAVRETDLALVAVGTPSAADGSVETRAVERVVEAIGLALRRSPRPYTLVLRSTLLPGVLEDNLIPRFENAAGPDVSREVVICNNPEFLRESSALRDYDHPPFVLVGAEDEAQAAPVLELYDHVAAPKLVTDTRTAALVKYASNAFHALKVTFANEIGTLSQALGADGQEVMRLVCQDRQLNVSPAYLRPGFAFGGSCLPKDLRALTRFAQRSAIDAELLSAILPSNRSHLERAIAAIRASGQRRVGLVGLSFKAGTDDLRESPLVAVAETLLGRGYDLRIYDPGVRMSSLSGSNLAYVDRHLPHLAALLVDDAAELFEHAELLVLGTNVADELEMPPFAAFDVLDLRKDLVTARPAAVPAVEAGV